MIGFRCGTQQDSILMAGRGLKRSTRGVVGAERILKCSRGLDDGVVLPRWGWRRECSSAVRLEK